MKTLQPSPDAETSIHFTKPLNRNGKADGRKLASIKSCFELFGGRFFFLLSEYPGGVLVKFLVGLYNKGEMDFVIQSVDAAFHYPMDYSFYIQNVSLPPAVTSSQQSSS